MSQPTTEEIPEPQADTAGASTDSRDTQIGELQQRVAQLERLPQRESLAQDVKAGAAQRSIRLRSKRQLWGLAVYDIAFGPAPDGGSRKGHAKGIIAIGDRATGVLAVGGLAQGVIAIGGLSWGVVSVGGCTLGLAAALGGVAVGGIALGGVAIGIQAFGGVAIAALPVLQSFFTTTSSVT